MGELTRRARLGDADSRMAHHLAEAARHWWGIGQVCLDVAREQLYEAGDHADVFAWAFDRHRIARKTVAKAMDVATHFSAEMAERHGSEKLASTVAYLETTKKVEKAGEAIALKFRVHRDGKFRSIPFEQASYRDIDDARMLVEKTRHPEVQAPDPATVARAEALAATLSPAPNVRGDRVQVERGADGRQRFTFRAIPEEELEAFARAVLGMLTR